MRRLARLACAAVIATTLLAPAAGAEVSDIYRRLAERDLSPAPLVFVRAPRRFQPIDDHLEATGSDRRSGYGVRLVSTGGSAIIALDGGSFRTLRALLRTVRGDHVRIRRTRVRGKRGLLLTKRFGADDRRLAWVEGGRVYQLVTSQLRTVSAGDLRAAAKRLEPLGGWYIGAPDPASSTEAEAVTTERTISARVTWEATCRNPDFPDPQPREGSAEVAFLRLHGTALSFDIARHQRDGWRGTVTGTVSRDSIALGFRATGTFDGFVCDSGPVSFSIPRSRR